MKILNQLTEQFKSLTGNIISKQRHQYYLDLFIKATLSIIHNYTPNKHIKCKYKNHSWFNDQIICLAKKINRISMEYLKDKRTSYFPNTIQLQTRDLF